MARRWVGVAARTIGRGTRALGRLSTGTGRWAQAQLVGCLALTLGVAGSVAADTPCPGVDTVVIGHRGTGTDTDDNPFPENTIASFMQAVTEGATMIELDVQLSQDGALVVMHDDTVNRTTDGTGCVAELDLAELQALNAGTETIPTLEEVFAAVEVDVNVEIKVADEGGPCPATDRRAVASALTMVLGSAGDRTIVVSSFDFNQLLAVRAADPDVRLASLFVARDGFAPALAEGMDAHPLVLAVRAIEVDAHHAAGLAVRPFTVNDEVTQPLHRDFWYLWDAKNRMDNNIDLDEYWLEKIHWAERKGKQNLVRAKITGNAMNLVTRRGQSPEVPIIEFCSEWWRLWSQEYQQPIQTAVNMPFLSSIPRIEDRRSCKTLAAQLLLAEFLSPDFYQTGKPWRQRWSLPCNRCFELTENYRGSSQTTKCRDCADNWFLRTN